MALTKLDDVLRKLQTRIVQQSNRDLVFGGTTQQEYNFLSQAALQNNSAPNFYSFMAGISASNLAEQQNRQLEFERATALRNQESQLAMNAAGINQTNANIGLTQARTHGQNATTAATEAGLPYIGQQQQANIGLTQARTRGQNASAASTEATLPYIDDQQQLALDQGYANIDYQDSRTAGQDIDNRYAPRQYRSDIRAKDSHARLYDRQHRDAPTKPLTAQQARQLYGRGAPVQPQGFQPPTGSTAPIAPPSAPVYSPNQPISPGQSVPVYSPTQPISPGQSVPVVEPFDAGMGEVLRSLVLKQRQDLSYRATPEEVQAYQTYLAYKNRTGQAIDFGAAP